MDFLRCGNGFEFGSSRLHGEVMISIDEWLAEIETPTAPVEAPIEAPKEKEKKSELEEAEEDAEPKDEHGATKPPEDGLCRNCRQRKPLNRLKLCYPCWVELCLKDEAKKRGGEWKSGDPHPAWCSCEGLGEHKNGDGTARGFN